MKSKLQRLTTTTPNHFIDVRLSYDMGGINYATMRPKVRGYYLSVTPVESSTDSSGITFDKYIGFSGVTALVETTPRLNRRRFAELELYVLHSELYQRLLLQVLQSRGLTLATTDAPSISSTPSTSSTPSMPSTPSTPSTAVPAV